MTVELRDGGTAAIGLAEFLAGIEALRLDPEDEAGYAAAAPLLGALGRDRRFLGDLVVAALRERAAGQERDNDYGAQVLLLHRGPGWFVRANLWPDAADPLLRASGAERFFYGIPHDHNFCFLTVGYLGPGYWSDYYDYERDAVAGLPGEPVALRFVERSRLSEGRLLLYRAHRDVHSQHLPDALSVSLNLVQGTAGRALCDQYRFDVDRGLIAGQLARSPIDALLALLPDLGGEEGADLLCRFAQHHPSDRIRFGAIAAQLASLPDAAARAAVLERAARTGNRYVAAAARARLVADAAARTA